MTNTKKTVARLVTKAYEKARTYRILKEATGVNPSQLSSYRAGKSLPSAESLVAMLDYVGAGITFLDDEPPQGPTTTMKRVEGRVTAGSVDLAGFSDDEVPVPDAIWHASPYWHHTTGEVVLLRVYGESMMPRYHHGDVLACRQPDGLPEAGTPVVLRHNDAFTFKLFCLSHDGRHVVGLPLNRDFDPVVLPAKAGTHVQYVVLGHINLGR